MSLIFVVTGASGVGKTALVRGLESRQLPDVRCHYFDSVGVPTVERMTAEFGSAEEWQWVTTRRWIARLAEDRDRGHVQDAHGPRAPFRARETADRGLMLPE